MLTSQADLAELHKRLAPLVVPPQNADGSVSKRKMKEVIVKVTDKGDDANSSASNGKKKNESQEQSNSAVTYDEIHQKRIAIHEAIRAHWKCDMHTLGDRAVPCWQDGHTTQCYVITENDLNLWAKLHIKNPTTVSIDTKPPQINLYHSIHHRGSQDKH
ncbi:hypothetical protein DFH94DRAFT_686038 [Russula ochroleuca]|uniref:Uncharacterized protein n=1 Tax=Russula ochroleuca TaxID=152965 RepID=A0A9P5JVB6_9AGAM|nr:hypothetical protein DFH94DRAFT_686038 [Russula ochroleuca]